MTQALKVGDLVTCKRSEPAYYSGYAGQPVQNFEPGMVGVIASTHVPYVTGRRGWYYCVDFTGADKVTRPPCNTWRVGLHPDNIVLLNLTGTARKGEIGGWVPVKRDSATWQVLAWGPHYFTARTEAVSWSIYSGMQRCGPDELHSAELVCMPRAVYMALDDAGRIYNKCEDAWAI